MSRVEVIHKFAKTPANAVVIDACNNNPENQFAGINPFLAGPCELYDGQVAQVMENAWQFSKVYHEHADNDMNPLPTYFEWARTGWANPQAIRFPMGRGRAPLYCLWNGERLGYVESRKRIYGPLYIRAIQNTESYRLVRELYEGNDVLYIRDWDGWSMTKHGFGTLTQVINCVTKRMGHAFFLKALLENDPVLELLDL